MIPAHGCSKSQFLILLSFVPSWSFECLLRKVDFEMRVSTSHIFLYHHHGSYICRWSRTKVFLFAGK